MFKVLSNHVSHNIMGYWMFIQTLVCSIGEGSIVLADNKQCALCLNDIQKKNITGVTMYPLRAQLFSSWRIIVISWRLQHVQYSENSYPVLIVQTRFQLEQSQTRCPALQGFKDVFKLNGVLYLANWMLYMKSSHKSCSINLLLQSIFRYKWIVLSSILHSYQSPTIL